MCCSCSKQDVWRINFIFGGVSFQFVELNKECPDGRWHSQFSKSKRDHASLKPPPFSLKHSPGSRSHAGWWRWLWLVCHSGTHDISGSWCFCPVQHMQSPWGREKHRVKQGHMKGKTKKNTRMKMMGGFV